MFDLFAGHQQMLVVTTSGWDEVQGTLHLFERANKESLWLLQGAPFPVVVGKNGMAWSAYKVEGDGKSPAGIFALGTAFGFEPCSLKMEYLQIDEFTEAVDDPESRYYNTIVNSQKVVPDWSSSEKMWEIPLYELGLVIEHNFPNPVKNAGSAIFFHIWRRGDSGTAGCTAMSRDNLVTLLSWLDQEKDPVLVQLPLAAYCELQNEWRLPSLNY